MLRRPVAVEVCPASGHGVTEHLEPSPSAPQVASGEEVRQLRDEIAKLRAIMRSQLDGGEGADRGRVLAAAKLLSEKNKRLAELEHPGWLE